MNREDLHAVFGTDKGDIIRGIINGRQNIYNYASVKVLPEGRTYNDCIMEAINEEMNGFGIEPIRDPSHWDNYWGDYIAIYVNMGDTYSATILYDTRDNKYILTSYGDFIEGRGCNA